MVVNDIAPAPADIWQQRARREWSSTPRRMSIGRAEVAARARHGTAAGVGLRIPKGATTVSEVSSTQIKLISRTIECTPENSSNLERAPGARSIGDEFS
eukprot:3409110-Prymnesium_polylepis.1